MADELTPEQRELLAKEEEERAYGKFKTWLDRYSEEKKPEEPAPPKTEKPSGGIFSTLFGG
jgi:hypothetical protein